MVLDGSAVDGRDRTSARTSATSSAAAGLPARPVPAASPAVGLRRPTRQLPDRILVAVHEACDLGALDVAGALLGVLETVLSSAGQSSPTAQKRSMEGLVAAHGRVWHLRHDRELILDDPHEALR